MKESTNSSNKKKPVFRRFFNYLERIYLNPQVDYTTQPYIEKHYRIVILHVFLRLSSIFFIIFAYISFFVLYNVATGVYQFVAGMILMLLLFLLRRDIYYKYIALATSTSLALGSFIYIYIVHALYYSFLWTIFVPFTYIFFLGNKSGFKYVLVFYILILLMGIHGVFHWNSEQWTSVTFTYYAMAFTGFTFFFMFTDYSMSKQQRWLIWLAETDALTKLYNRRKLEFLLQEEFQKSQKSNSFLSVAILDIDNFKSINDNFGHSIGDQVLIELSGILKKNIFEGAFVGRWGGEEFLFILPKFSPQEAKKAIQDFKNDVSNYSFKTVKKLGCSVGIYGVQNPQDMEKMIIAADYAMYEAKKSKTNKVIIFNNKELFL